MKSESRPYVILIFCVLSWGSSYVAIKIGLESFAPTQVASYRLFVAGIISLAFATINRIGLPTLQQFRQIVIIAFVGIFIYHISITYFTVYFEPNVVSFVSNTAPIFIVIFSHLILNEHLRNIRWSGFWLALLGIGIMNYQSGTIPDWRQLGLLILPASGALFFVLQKPLLKEMKPTHMMHWCIIIGTLMLLLWDASFLNELTGASFQSHLAIIYLGIIPTVAAFQLWAYLLSKTAASNLASPIYLVPTSTILFSMIIFHRIPEVTTVLGGSITILGVVLSRQKQKVNESIEAK